MEEAAEKTYHLENNCSSLLANPFCGSNNDDVIVAEPPTKMGERAVASDPDANQNVGLDADIGIEDPKWVRRELSSEERVLAYQMLLEMSTNGKLKKNATGLVADMFHANIRLIQRLWKRGKASGNHNVSLRRVMNCGRKRIEFDLQRFKEIPLRKRGTLRSCAAALGVSKTFIMSKLKSGELRRHSSHVKPTLTETNRMDRIKHCLSMLDPEAPPASPSFVQMENVIHIDEKWFQMTKKKQTYYLLPDEDDPVRHCKSSNFIPKIMFLAAVARPRYDHNGNCTFDGRIGVFPLVTEVAAARSSANRVAGTLELKPILKVNRNIIRQYMIDYVLPTIRDKWPHDSIRELIIIQQDNAKTHIHENDIEFLAAIHNVGLHIQLRCQPPNSPDLNVLDLGFFRAIQSLQAKECAKDVRNLVSAVNKAFCEFSDVKANNIFLTLQSCMVETLKILGSNRYRIPHLKKDHLARVGMLPSSISCDPEIISRAAAHLPLQPFMNKEQKRALMQTEEMYLSLVDCPICLAEITALLGCFNLVWYPSIGVEPFKQEDFLQLDPELEFDREVYPLGLLPNSGVVVGVSQRMSFSACTEFPCFEPTSQAQTILHCLLRHLLQRDKIEEAFRLAQLSAEKPHFSHCLEWLLFTVFEAEISRPNVNKNQISVPKPNGDRSLLEKTCDLIRNFPEYLDVVVSVARKTDGRHWADLFTTAGRSTELFEECFQHRWYRTAACYILVIAKLEGPAVSQYSALRLLQATLDESLYELAGELVRFLLRSGKEYEQTSTDSDRLSPRFLGYFLFRSSYRKPSLDKSTSFKEQSAHVASVKSILESHASYLMSGKELSKLVAFVKGTQFDLVEYLQRERYGSARLENFAAGLELIGQKLQMGTLQSRLDAEFLLAHMCSVKFKEWIVVLATLLRRSEVLFDLFRHDARLWKAYSTTLQSHPAFCEYHDLLEGLEDRLSSVSHLEEN